MNSSINSASRIDTPIECVPRIILSTGNRCRHSNAAFAGIRINPDERIIYPAWVLEIDIALAEAFVFSRFYIVLMQTCLPIIERIDRNGKA